MVSCIQWYSHIEWLKVSFTLSNCICDFNVGDKFAPLISMMLSTSSDGKHQMKKLATQMQSLSVNAPNSLKHY